MFFSIIYFKLLLNQESASLCLNCTYKTKALLLKTKLVLLIIKILHEINAYCNFTLLGFLGENDIDNENDNDNYCYITFTKNDKLIKHTSAFGSV